MKREEMTAKVESIYVDLAKRGVRGAAKALYAIYETEIQKAHLYSAVGYRPQKFGYGKNNNGRSYESHSGQVFITFYKALMSFDTKVASTTAALPFLSYATNIIANRALDTVRDETKRESRYQSFSKLGSEARKHGENTTDVDAVEAAAHREWQFDPANEERKQAELENTVRSMLGSLKQKNTEAYKFASACYDVARESANGKVSMAKVAQRYGNKRDNRSGMYHYVHKTLVQIPAETIEQFHAALGCVGE